MRETAVTSGLGMTRSRGDWMQTFTGRRFFPLDPHPDEIDPVDIAHALSLICRYGGHVDRFYSVAEHCILISEAVAPEHRLWALLHDATEAYVGDMIRPLKVNMGEYRMAEDRVALAIARRFGLWDGTGLPPLAPTEVKEADTRILLTERNALMSATRHPWAMEDMEPLPVEVRGLAPTAAEIGYLNALAAALSEQEAGR